MPKDVYYKINESKRNKLVKSAFEAFSKDTYENLTVSEITQTMKILRTDFYYYFKDKDTEASRIYTEYKQRGGKEFENFVQRKDYRYMQVFKQYENLEKAIRKQGKQAELKGDKAGKEAADQKIQDIHEEIARRCLDIYFDRNEVK